MLHAPPNWDDAFEVAFPSIAGTDRELLSGIGILVPGIVATGADVTQPSPATSGHEWRRITSHRQHGRGM